MTMEHNESGERFDEFVRWESSAKFKVFSPAIEEYNEQRGDWDVPLR